MLPKGKRIKLVDVEINAGGGAVMELEGALLLEKTIGGTESTTVDEAAGGEDPSFGGRTALGEVDAEDTIALEKKIGGTESTTVDDAAGEEDP